MNLYHEKNIYKNGEIGNNVSNKFDLPDGFAHNPRELISKRRVYQLHIYNYAFYQNEVCIDHDKNTYEEMLLTNAITRLTSVIALFDLGVEKLFDV